jgi:acyl-CoA synthetase (AMP-forming)/AMP-acid ligase II
MRIEQFLSDSAQRLGPVPAIVAAGRSHSYRDLGRGAERVAVALGSRGVRLGDHVAVVMDNNYAAVVTTFGVLMAGGVVCAIDPRTGADKLQNALKNSHAVALATEARFASATAAALATTTSIRLVLLSGGDRSTASASCLCFEDLIAGIGPGPGVPRAGTASDPAIVLGTAGAETVTLTHADIVAAASATSHAGPASGLRSILSHHGLCQLLAAIRAGATIVLESSPLFSHGVFSREADGAEATPALAG